MVYIGGFNPLTNLLLTSWDIQVKPQNAELQADAHPSTAVCDTSPLTDISMPPPPSFQKLWSFVRDLGSRPSYEIEEWVSRVCAQCSVARLLVYHFAPHIPCDTAISRNICYQMEGIDFRISRSMIRPFPLYDLDHLSLRCNFC